MGRTSILFTIFSVAAIINPRFVKCEKPRHPKLKCSKTSFKNTYAWSCNSKRRMIECCRVKQRACMEHGVAANSIGRA